MNRDAEQEAEKRAAAEAASTFIEDGMKVGLGTGTTVAFLLDALARGAPKIRCVATSPRTERAARDLGLAVEDFATLDRLDVTIDGADQIAPDGWMVKGGGAAHTREKIVAAAAERFIVMADSSKVVTALGPPVPLELLAFGLPSTLARLGDACKVRADTPTSPDGGVIADYYGAVDDPAAVAAHLASIPGVVDHGLFPPSMVDRALVAHGRDVETLTFGRS